MSKKNKISAQSKYQGLIDFVGVLLQAARQKIQTLPGFLSWTQIVELLSVEDDLARSFV